MLPRLAQEAADRQTAHSANLGAMQRQNAQRNSTWANRLNQYDAEQVASDREQRMGGRFTDPNFIPPARKPWDTSNPESTPGFGGSVASPKDEIGPLPGVGLTGLLGPTEKATAAMRDALHREFNPAAAADAEKFRQVTGLNRDGRLADLRPGQPGYSAMQDANHEKLLADQQARDNAYYGPAMAEQKAKTEYAQRRANNMEKYGNPLITDQDRSGWHAQDVTGARTPEIGLAMMQRSREAQARLEPKQIDQNRLRFALDQAEDRAFDRSLGQFADDSTARQAQGYDRMRESLGIALPTAEKVAENRARNAAIGRFDKNSEAQLRVSANAAGMPISAPMANYQSLVNTNNTNHAPGLNATALALGPEAAVSMDPELSRNRLMAAIIGQNVASGGTAAPLSPSSINRISRALGGRGVGSDNTIDVPEPPVNPKTGAADIQSSITAVNAQFPDLATNPASRVAAQRWLAERGIDINALRSEHQRRRGNWPNLNRAFSYQTTLDQQQREADAVGNILGDTTTPIAASPSVSAPINPVPTRPFTPSQLRGGAAARGRR